jgi:transcriptional regulator with XRE-family HTH domain
MWLRAQMRIRNMTQRQLAERSGVHHSTISRVITGRRSINLQTAARLAECLGTRGSEVDGWPYLQGASPGRMSDIARVEYALRSDSLLREQHVKEVMTAYLKVRGRLAPDRPILAGTLTRIGTRP